MSFFQHIAYYILLSVMFLFSLLPLRVLYLIAEVFYFLIYKVIGYRKKVVLENLRNAFPEKNETEIKKICSKFYRHFACLFVENIELRFVNKKRFKKRYFIENEALFYDLYNKGKNVVNMTAHIGNWEYGSGVAGQLPFKAVAVYKELSSKPFDKIFYKVRKRLGNHPIEMNDVLREVIGLVKDNKPFVLSMVTDQSPMKSSSKHWINFLNQETNVYLGSERIAKKYNMAVIYTEIVRHKKGKYKITPKLITENAAHTADFEITETYFKLLEESIKKHPRYWLWSHRRWKHKRPVEQNN